MGLVMKSREGFVGIDPASKDDFGAIAYAHMEGETLILDKIEYQSRKDSSDGEGEDLK